MSPPDQVILVDSEDNELGVMDKVEAHRGEGKLHRASSVFLFNKDSKVLVQQRSKQKIVGALQWANTCCGNVRPGESYKDCAVRRLREELGIQGVQLSEVTKFEYQVKCNEEFSEHEMDTVFVGNYDRGIKINTQEVNQHKWIRWEELLLQHPLAPWIDEMQKQRILEHVIQGKNMMERNQLRNMAEALRDRTFREGFWDNLHLDADRYSEFELSYLVQIARALDKDVSVEIPFPEQETVSQEFVA